ncbi:hypothetical protein ABLT31_15850 [Ammoniphilus sp. 3BR4]
MMIRNILSTLLVFFCLFLSLPVMAMQQEPTNRVSVVLINHLSLEDVKQMESMENGLWIKQGVIGAMNLRTAAEINEWNNLVTMNSGSRAVGPAKSAKAYMGEEKVQDMRAWEVYQQLVGFPGEEEAIYLPDFRQLVDNNRKQPYTIQPGLLGDQLQRYGIHTYVMGNSDRGQDKVRFAPLLVTNSQGVVEAGDISDRVNRKNPQRVYGISTNYDYMLSQVQVQREKSPLMVLELGDLYRLYSAKGAMDETHFSLMKERILEEMNGFMKTLVESRSEEELILVLTPMVHSDAQAMKSMMAPFIHVGPHKGEGILYTSTTRQAGVVANMDVTPTILQWLGIPIPQEVTGRAISVVQGNQSFWSDWEEIKHIYSTRSTVLYGYVTFQVAVLILAAAFWFFARPGHSLFPVANGILRFLLLVITLSPFMFLILPLFPAIKEAKLTVIFLLVLGTALSASVIRLPFPWLFFFISLINWVPVLLDGIGWQSALMKRSYLGYDPIIGARYYGIGNEYMGVVIGSSILSLAMLLELTKKHMRIVKAIAMGVFSLYLVFFSLPGWGTNAGGALTAVAAYSTSFVRLFDVRLNARYIFWGLLSIVVALSSLFLINMMAADQMQSHIGRAMQKLVQGEWSEIFNIVERKLAMNWKLIGVSSWSKVFITSLLVLGLLCYRPAGMIGRLSEKYPYAVRGFFGIIVGAFTALVVNDSGIVAAATTIIYMVVPLLFLGLEEKVVEKQGGVDGI